MAQFSCPNVSPCLDPSNPLRNLSSEADDGPTFLVLAPGNWYVPPPPIGSNWRNRNCVGFAESPTSYSDALLSARNACISSVTTTQGTPPSDVPPNPPGTPPTDPPGQPNGTNVFPNPEGTPSGLNNSDPPIPPATPPAPPNPPVPPQGPPVTTSGPNTVSILCPDGLPFTIIIPPGLIVGYSQAEADLIARAYVEQNLLRLRFCLSDFTAATCVDEAISSGTISVSGGTGPFTITADGVPIGMSFQQTDARTAVISGSPDAGGTYNVRVRATDPLGNFMEKTYTIEVIGFLTSSLPDSLPFVPYSTAIQTQADEPIRFQLPFGLLPPGIDLDVNTGVLSGTPTTPGTYTFTISITSLTTQNVCLREFSIHIFPHITWTTFANNITGFPTYTVTALGGTGTMSGDCDGGVQDDSVDLHANTTIFNDLAQARTVRITFAFGYLLSCDPQPPVQAALASYTLQDFLHAPIISQNSIATPPGGSTSASGLTFTKDISIPGNSNVNIQLLLNVSAGAGPGLTAKALAGGGFTIAII